MATATKSPKSTVAQAARKGAAKRKPAVKAAVKVTPVAAAPVVAPVERAEKDSVTATFTLTRLAAKAGGHRFEVENDRAFSPFYMDQGEWKSIGSPERIRVTVKAL